MNILVLPQLAAAGAGAATGRVQLPATTGLAFSHPALQALHARPGGSRLRPEQHRAPAQYRAQHRAQCRALCLSKANF
ncbi:hypothetical protein [Hymenobacter saemangeumensis]|uniref:hypothetical protein n=1 Tax=Hymenobacter saemangeumensis TaxID=1084522 RepID=UPI0031E72240